MASLEPHFFGGLFEVANRSRETRLAFVGRTLTLRLRRRILKAGSQSTEWRSEMDALNERIVDLEIRYTHQQELVEQLSDIIRTQQQKIDLLRREMTQVLQMLDPGTDENQKPPHY